MHHYKESETMTSDIINKYAMKVMETQNTELNSLIIKFFEKFPDANPLLLTIMQQQKHDGIEFSLAYDFENHKTKPVDVAAVREQCAIIAEGFRDKHWIAHDMKTGIFPNRSEAGIAIAAAIRALSPAEPFRKFKMHDRLTKIKGSKWTGRVVGYYSTDLTPIGYAIESETETGSVQIYPEGALMLAPASKGDE